MAPGRQCGSGPPVRATTTPTAPAASSVTTTLRRNASRSTAAPARTPNCHDSPSARPSGIAEPRIAPIAAGPAPSRNVRAALVGAEPVEAAAAEQDERERRRERDGRGEQAAADARGRVADDRDGLHDGARRDLAERDRVEELPVRHPVVVVDRVVLHQRDDHEAAAVGERADLERDPREREQPAGRDRDAGAATSDTPRSYAAPPARSRRSRAGRRRATGRPSRPPLRPQPRRAASGRDARRGARLAGTRLQPRVHRHRCDRSARARAGAEHPVRRRARKEHRREREDQRSARAR